MSGPDGRDGGARRILSIWLPSLALDCWRLDASEAEKALEALSAACEGWELDWLDAYRASIEGDYERAERSLKRDAKMT